MAIQTTEALVLNRRDLRETSMIATFYSKDFGKIKGVLKGIRSDRSRYGSQAELFGLNKIVSYEKARNDFQNITQCDLMDGFFGIRKDLNAIAYASYLAELADRLTEPAEKSEEIFELLLGCFKLLSKGMEPVKIIRIFEIRFLTLLGFGPTAEGASVGHVKVSMGTAQTFNRLKSAGWDSLLKFRISKPVSDELGPLVDRLITAHLDRPLKSKKFIKELQRLKR
jgi:DNA repair protein RecO (recombination protein O)